MSYNYEKEVLINDQALDAEWKNQPTYTLKYGLAKADAQRDADTAKEALNYLCAKKDGEIRESCDKKPTEAQIANMVLMDPDVQKAKKALIEAQYNLNMLQVACYAFNDRKSALENLVKLFGMNYFSEPIADIEARGTLDDMSSNAAISKVKKAMGHTERRPSEPIMQRRK